MHMAFSLFKKGVEEIRTKNHFQEKATWSEKPRPHGKARTLVAKTVFQNQCQENCRKNGSHYEHPLGRRRPASSCFREASSKRGRGEGTKKGCINRPLGIFMSYSVTGCRIRHPRRKTSSRVATRERSRGGGGSL